MTFAMRCRLRSSMINPHTQLMIGAHLFERILNQAPGHAAQRTQDHRQVHWHDNEVDVLLATAYARRSSEGAEGKRDSERFNSTWAKTSIQKEQTTSDELASDSKSSVLTCV